MASISTFFSPTTILHHHFQNPTPRITLNRKPSYSSLQSPHLTTKRYNNGFCRLPRVQCSTVVSKTSKEKLEFDVVIVGAGIIGLSIAKQLLEVSKLSVAVVDAAVPCAGATGAGQGYVWMCHKTPGSDRWELGARSKRLWEMLAMSIEHQGLDPLQVLGWKKTGSLLIGKTLKELALLKDKVKLLSEAGVRAEYLSANALFLREPALAGGDEFEAAFLPDDCQIDASRTVAFIEKANRSFAAEGRYAEFYHDPAISLIRSEESGDIEAVQTSKNTLYCKKAVVIAAGSWSGSLMKDLMKKFNISLDVPVKPRKGHLLVVENVKTILLNHGLMEVGYASHEAVSTSEAMDIEQALSISMTATLDSTGNLVLGSSRQFAGFNTEVEDSIINRIWLRAQDFFPALRELSLADMTKNKKVRIGLRPYVPDGKPIIGPVPGVPKVLLATGHEGEGLSTALGTAEMVTDMVLGNSGKINFTPFAVKGRC